MVSMLSNLYNNLDNHEKWLSFFYDTKSAKANKSGE